VFTILFLSANPSKTDPLELIKECNQINQKIRSSAGRELLKLEQRHDISIKWLIEELLNYNPQILHFSGHGSDKSALIFKNENTGEIEEVPPSALSKLFKVLGKKIDLIFLNACYSEQQARAIAEHVNCVIGMSDAISDIAAIEFASTFYSSLGFGRNIEDSFDLATVQLELLSIPENAIPKLIVKEGIDPSKIKILNNLPSYYNQKIDQHIENQRNQIQEIKTKKHQQKQPSKFKFIGEKRIFVGRKEYLDNKIKNALKDVGSRISIVGPGGSGKSQLAFKALHQYYEKDKLIDLVIPLYLYAIVSTTSTDHTYNDRSNNDKIPALTFKKFLNEIGSELIKQGFLQISKQEFEQLSIEDSKSQIIEVFDEREHPLLYCDNFEMLSSLLQDNNSQQDIKEIFNFLNNDCPQNTSILITSRNRRNFLVDEQIIDLKGLKVEEGVDLFIKNAATYKNHLEDKKQMIEIIVTKTGGHPLSLEILANSYEGGGTKELEIILQTLGIERENPFEPEERLQTLHRSFQYSIDKLDLAIKNLLPAVTILHSPFLSEAVDRIFTMKQKEHAQNNEKKYKDPLLKLYSKSLLERIEEDESGSLINDKFWLYSIHPALRNFLEDKYNNYIKNIEKKYILFFCYYYYNLIIEIYNAWGKDDHKNFIHIFKQITKSEISDFDRSIEFFKEAEQQELKKFALSIASYLGQIYHNLGNYDKSLQYHKKALNISEELKNDMNIAIEYTRIGLAYYRKGMYDEALQYHMKALQIYEELEDKSHIASNYGDIGLVHYKKGHYDEALQYHMKALEIDEELKDRMNIARDFGNIGDVYSGKRLHDKALLYYTRGLAIDEELNDLVNIAWDYASIGEVYHNKKHYDKALQYHNKALKINEKLKDRVNMAKNYASIGEVYHNKKHYDKALQYLKSALQIGEELKNNLYLVKNYCGIGYVYLYKKDLTEAKLAVDNAIKVIREFEQGTQRKHPFRDMASELLYLLEKTK
jgi:tetratricopeptide (TPR) repeat protein